MKTALEFFKQTQTDSPEQNPVEVGIVRWSRDYDAATKASAETGTPIFALFQEVPGCRGCKNFGEYVLKHPTIVKAIEEEFLPVLIYNNRSEGQDEILRQHFQEPAWNFQVVRFFDAKGEDIIPRAERVWDINGIAARMKKALKFAQRDVPEYLAPIQHKAE